MIKLELKKKEDLKENDAVLIEGYRHYVVKCDDGELRVKNMTLDFLFNNLGSVEVIRKD